MREFLLVLAKVRVNSHENSGGNPMLLER